MSAIEEGRLMDPVETHLEGRQYGRRLDPDADLPGMRSVFWVEPGGSYDWDAFASWLDVDSGVFYWYEDSGCSCNSPGEMLRTLGDLQSGDREALTRAYVSFAKDCYSMTSEEKASARHDITQAVREALKG